MEILEAFDLTETFESAGQLAGADPKVEDQAAGDLARALTDEKQSLQRSTSAWKELGR